MGWVAVGSNTQLPRTENSGVTNSCWWDACPQEMPNDLEHVKRLERRLREGLMGRLQVGTSRLPLQVQLGRPPGFVCI